MKEKNETKSWMNTPPPVREAEEHRILSGEYLKKEILLKKASDNDFKIYLLRELEENVQYATPSGNKIERLSQRAIVNDQHFININLGGPSLKQTPREKNKLSSAACRLIIKNGHESSTDNLSVLARSMVLWDPEESHVEESEGEWLFSPRDGPKRPVMRSTFSETDLTKTDTGPILDDLNISPIFPRTEASGGADNIFNSPTLASPSMLSDSLISISPIVPYRQRPPKSEDKIKHTSETLSLNNETVSDVEITQMMKKSKQMESSRTRASSSASDFSLQTPKSNINNARTIRRTASQSSHNSKKEENGFVYNPQLFKPQRQIRYQHSRPRRPSPTLKSKSKRNTKYSADQRARVNVGRTSSGNSSAPDSISSSTNRPRNPENRRKEGLSYNAKTNSRSNLSRIPRRHATSKKNKASMEAASNTTMFPPLPTHDSLETIGHLHNFGSISYEDVDQDDLSSVVSYTSSNSSLYSQQSVESKNWKLLQWRNNSKRGFLADDIGVRRTEREARKQKNRERLIESTIVASSLFQNMFDKAISKVVLRESRDFDKYFVAIPIPQQLVVQMRESPTLVDCHLYLSETSMTSICCENDVKMEATRSLGHQQVHAFVEIQQPLDDSQFHSDFGCLQHELWYEFVVNGSSQPRQKFTWSHMGHVYMRDTNDTSVAQDITQSWDTTEIQNRKQDQSDDNSDEDSVADIELSIVDEDNIVITTASMNVDQALFLHDSNRSDMGKNLSTMVRKRSVWGQLKPTVAEMAIRRRQMEQSLKQQSSPSPLDAIQQVTTNEIVTKSHPRQQRQRHKKQCSLM